MGSAPTQRQCIATNRSVGVVLLVRSINPARVLHPVLPVLKFSQRAPKLSRSGALILRTLAIHPQQTMVSLGQAMSTAKGPQFEKLNFGGVL